MNEMLERAALGYCGNDGMRPCSEACPVCLKAARAVIEALREPTVNFEMRGVSTVSFEHLETMNGCDPGESFQLIWKRLIDQILGGSDE